MCRSSGAELPVQVKACIFRYEFICVCICVYVLAHLQRAIPYSLFSLSLFVSLFVSLSLSLSHTHTNLTAPGAHSAQASPTAPLPCLPGGQLRQRCASRYCPASHAAHSTSCLVAGRDTPPYTHTRARTHTHAHTHTHTHTHTNTHTHTHTHTP